MKQKNRMWGGQNSLLAFLFLFLLTLLPCKGWADETWTDPNGSGLELNYTVVYGGVSITKMITAPTDGKVVIPSKIGTKTVVAIGDRAFMQQKTISAVEIPASVKNIADFAFSNCTSLASISFADESELTPIGQMAFSGGSYTKVTIPKKVTRIGQQAFDFNTNLLEITFLNPTPCTLGASLFTGELAAGFKIYVPTEAVNAYKSASNNNWRQLAEYIQEIPSTPQPGDVITDDTFKYTVNEDGTSVTLVGYKDEDTAPTSITIPATVQGFDVTSIEEMAFSDENLISVHFADDSKLVTISAGAFAQSGVTSITIPASVQEIGQQAFAMCASLSSVTFAENANLKKIGAVAFGGTALTEITIPASVETIVGGAFYKCVKLDKVTMLSSTPCTLEPFEDEGVKYELFKNCPLTNKIHVPEDAISAYKEDTENGWADYKDYIYEPSATITSGNLKYELNADGETVTVLGLADDAEDKYTVNIRATVKVTVNGVEKDCKVTAIAADAFKDSGASVTVGENVTSVGANALDGAMKITFLGTTAPELGDNALGSDWGGHLGRYITVPAHSAATYSNASSWSNYQDAIMAEPFDYNGGKFTILADGNAAFVGYKNYETEYSIPERVFDDNGNYEVVRIMGSKVDFSTIEKLTIPRTVKTIDEGAFSNVGDQLQEINYLREDAYDVTIGNQNLQMATGLKAIYVKNQEMLLLLKEKLDDQSKDKVQVVCCSSLADGQGVDNLAQGLYPVGELKYTRTITEDEKGGYITTCLPFVIDLSDAKYEGLFAGVWTFTPQVTYKEDGRYYINLQKIEGGTVAAGTPMLLKLNEDVETVTFYNAEALKNDGNLGVQPTDASVTGKTDVTIQYSGTYMKKSDCESVYSFNVDATFGKHNGSTLNPFRAYLTIVDAAGNAVQNASFYSNLNPGGGTTGINGVAADTVGTKAAIYSIDGKLVRKAGDSMSLAKGVYIIGGKKLVIK